ncbi:helix-turn-helix domain-containing protein [Lactiplantibacillus plantarum]|uniref:helix-turn-helix domain-containing protein n=1 Tax=Lactiplantibacillus sp. DA1 TaxID=3079857 RepID=UPI00292A60BB|nr:helix-turn-helix transcriptional regulator [Lactiplantibacillus sp. DA1]MCG0746347.1 helix-turn-helix domain-containing protein [Lactiplantibacillus plantarum]MCG0791280.1 helix-turn-helix domain-containing protein [Lactiplantibacillus plantarum]MDV0429690.1 helix-turn-helix transcriptional regulator [Lactiplantibacillus sp. DA1]
MASIGERIKEFRKSRHFTQAGLGQHVGLSAQVISNYERGYSTPSAEDIASIAAVLKIPISSLYATTNTELHATNLSPWASTTNRIDLDQLLQSNIPMGYGIMDWTQTDKERIRHVIEGVFWDRFEELSNHDSK